MWLASSLRIFVSKIIVVLVREVEVSEYSNEFRILYCIKRKLAFGCKFFDSFLRDGWFLIPDYEQLKKWKQYYTNILNAKCYMLHRGKIPEEYQSKTVTFSMLLCPKGVKDFNGP